MELRDLKGRAQVLTRIDRLANGNAGDVSPVGGGISELRIHSGPGYRVYFATRGRVLMLILAGDKSSQARDIVMAKTILAEWDA